jgi:hypothetical protein
MTTEVATDTGTSRSLWVLGVEAQELATAMDRVAEGLEHHDPAEQERAVQMLEAMLEANAQHQETLHRKADAYCYVIGQKRALADFRKAQAHRLTELARSEERQAERMEQALIDVMTRLNPGATSFTLPQHVIRSRSAVRVEITDEEAIPEELQRTKTTVAPDKDAIKKRLQAGEAVEGAALIESRTWRIC